jgi:DNA repair photolyase
MDARVTEVIATRALERSRRPCARSMSVVNPAVGCIHGCLFCPVRHRGRDRLRLDLKSNLPELLERELHKRKRQGTLPEAVLFGTASDSFQPVGPLHAVVHEAMKLLLQAGCHLHFVTRGVVPEGFARLFGQHREQVHAQVSLLAMDDNLAGLYESHAPPPRDRLECIRQLAGWGVDVRGRLDPLIPFLSDTAGHMEELLRHLNSAGVRRATASYLVLHPQMLELFQEALPAAHYQVIRGSFKGQAWQKIGIHQTTRLLPERTRRQGYQRLVSIGKRLGLDVAVCACTNPGLEVSRAGASCLAFDGAPGEPDRGQLELFRTA